MARIRSLHPGQWTDEAFVQCSAFARLLALGLRNEADDQGVFEWKPVTLNMRIFPADQVDMVALLQELIESRQLHRFDASGRAFGAIRNFRKWQRPEKPKAIHPLPDRLRAFVGLSPTGAPEEEGVSTTDRQPVDDSSATDPRLENTGFQENQSDSSMESTTSRRPVDDQSTKVSAEEGGRRKEGGDTRKDEGDSAQQRARAGFKVEADPALIVIEAFDQALTDAYGPERRRPFPAGTDIVFAKRWLAEGFKPQDLYQFFLARQRARKAAGKDPIGSLAFLENAVAEIGGTPAQAAPGAAPSAGNVRFLTPEQEIRARQAWWSRDAAAAKARGEPPPRIKEYGIWYDAHNGQETRLMSGERPPIPPAPPQEGVG